MPKLSNVHMDYTLYRVLSYCIVEFLGIVTEILFTQ